MVEERYGAPGVLDKVLLPPVLHRQVTAALGQEQLPSVGLGAEVEEAEGAEAGEEEAGQDDSVGVRGHGASPPEEEVFKYLDRYPTDASDQLLYDVMKTHVGELHFRTFI